jgi:ankyrin repeat protein
VGRARRGAPLGQTDDLGRNALWWACRSNQGQVALRLIALGAPIRADSEGTGPLHLAAGNDDRILVMALVEQTGVEAPAGDGNRPLMIAARAGAGDALAALLAAGADVKARNDVGDTALIVAVRAGHLAVTEQLLKAGANPKVRNDRFESAASLMAARAEPEWDSLLKSSEKGLFGLFGAL